MHVRCPHCHNPIELVDDAELSDIECPSCGSSFNLLGEQTVTHQKAENNTIGHFELVEHVGMGAFGSVWKAKDTELDRIVAVKIPRKGQLDPTEAEQFLREARSAAQLKHPNIVGIHEVGRDDGQTYIVSDFIEGLPLSSWLTGKQLTFREAAELCAKIAEALHHAHEAGVIHRDLKPSNIMIDSDGEPHIMDFGLAKRETGEITMTVDGKVLGTPAYMSPEQARGEAHAADRRSDVYSLGVILFEMLTGEKPFRGDFRMLIHQVLNEEAPGPRKLKATVPRDLDTICLKCLEKQTDKRYAFAKDLANELTCFLRGDPIRARPLSAVSRSWRWCQRNPLIASLSASVVMTLLIGLAGTSWQAILATQQSSRAFSAEQEAIQQTRKATDEATRADANSRNLQRQLRIATALRVVGLSQNVQKTFPVRSLLLAISAVDATQQHDEPVIPIAHELLLNTLHMVGGRAIPGNEGAFQSSPNGRWLAAPGHGNTGLLWDLSSSDPLTSMIELAGHAAAIRSFAFSLDCCWLVTSSEDNTALLWNLTSENPTASTRVFRVNSGAIRSVAISPNGRWLVIGNDDATAQLWDLHVRGPDASPRVLAGHSSRIRRAIFSPNSRWLLTASFENSFRLWDLTAEELSESSLVLSLPDQVNALPDGFKISPDSHWLISNNGMHCLIWDLTAEGRVSSQVLQGDEYVMKVKVSADSRWLVTTSSGRGARLWDLTGADFAPSSGVTLSDDVTATSIALSADSRWLVTAGYGSGKFPTHIWDLHAAEPAASSRLLQRHNGRVSSIAISPSGNWLMTGIDNGVSIQELRAGLPNKEPFILAHEGRINSIVLSADERWLVTEADRGGVITGRLWDLSAKGPSVNLVLPQENADRVVLSPNGRWLVGSRLWDLTTDEPVASMLDLSHEGRITSTGISPDSRWLLRGTAEVSRQSVSGGIGRLWDLTTEDPAASAIVVPDEGAVISVAIGPNSRWMVTTTMMNGRRAEVGFSARLWDLHSEDIAGSSRQLDGHESAKASISPNGRWLVTAGRDKTARLLDLTAEDPSASPQVLTHGEPIRSVALGDFRLVTLGMPSSGATARLWNLTAENASATSQVLVPGERAESISMSNDGRWLVVVSERLPLTERIRLWDFEAGDIAGPPRVLFAQRGQVGEVGLAVFLNGGWLVTTHGRNGRPNAARLWDLNSEDPTAVSRVLRGHESSIRSVDISTNGRWLVTGSDDKTARLWDLTSEDPTAASRVLRGHESSIRSVDISTDGRWLVTADDTTARLWDLDLDSLVDRARRVAGRKLTAEERQEYGLPLTTGQIVQRYLTSLRKFEPLLKKDLIEEILNDTSIAEQMRREALSVVRELRENPGRLNEASWSVVRNPGGTAEQYREALRQAAAASQLVPNKAMYLNTLGVAEYRLGEYEQAVMTLSRSDSLNRHSDPADVAFLAMAHHFLGNDVEASQLIQTLRQLVKVRPNAVSQQFLSEAESLVTPE